MKRAKYNFLYTLCAIILISSCSKEKTYIYQQNGGAFFDLSEYSYSFIDDPGVTTKIVNLPISISGSSVGEDREIIAEIPEGDTITTAEKVQYKIGKGVVKANQYIGIIPIEITYDERMDDSTFVLALKLVATADFPEVKLNSRTMKLSFTNKIIRPANWSWLRWYFGTPYSTAWWKFIMEVTGRTSLPYFPTNADKVTWWMSADDIIAYQGLVREALLKFNAGPKGPLVHDDGEYKNTKVEMP